MDRLGIRHRKEFDIVNADDRIYIGNRSGEMFVLRPGRTFELLATNRLDSGIFATPAAIDRAIYLRTEQAVYRIEQPQP